MLRWGYSYFTRGRGNRLITEAAREQDRQPRKR
jgi:hypothetical protein